jgi:hypothetical protein
MPEWVTYEYTNTNVLFIAGLVCLLPLLGIRDDC